MGRIRLASSYRYRYHCYCTYKILPDLAHRYVVQAYSRKPFQKGRYTDYQVDLSEGFIISKDKYIEFLEDKLEYIGLSDKEACDFISYWLPLMNEYEYCLVSFQKDYGEKVKIAYNIQPDNELILFVAFKGLDKPIKIEEQDLSYYNDFLEAQR